MPREKSNRGNGYNSNISVMDDYDPNASLMELADFPSAIKEFVEPGNDVVDLLMRTYFEDENKANAAILWYYKCDKWNINRGKQLLLNKLASNVSIKGLSRDELLQSVVGILRSEASKGIFKKKKRLNQENE